LTAPAETRRHGPFADPVFVLCNGRSGSTLLRFLLDAHPEVACPPETNLPMLCVQLATVWSLIEGAPLSANRGDEPPEIPDAAIAGVRETMDRMVGSYLARRGKKRYCDKSLGTAQFAELLSRVYPEARFICLYRHPMDVIASGMEACPWGLNGYGFEPYAAATPGNAVMALASFWADNVQTTLAAQERLADRSFQLRYEDLVAGPEETAAELFEFLGVSAAPGISDRCFSVERERFGPADYKIWYTSKISSESVGRGWSVPAGMIAPQLLAVINELAGRLGYLPVDGHWGATEPPADLRVPVTSPSASADGEGPAAQAPPAAPASMEGAGPAVDDPAPVGEDGRDDGGDAVPAGTARDKRPAAAVTGGPPCSARLGARLRAGLAAAAGGWGPHGSETFVAVVVTNDPHRPAEYWHVDLGAAALSLVTKDAQQDSDWDVIATLEVWDKLVDHQVNPSVALRSCALRYCGNGQSTPLAEDTRLGILAQLLGLAHWRRTRSPAP
jgi:hypothetical protein